MSTAPPGLTPVTPTFPASPTKHVYPGAKWWKMDFHTHTPASDDYANRAGPAKDLLKQQTPDDWLRKHMAVGLDAVVVSDHNSTGFIPRLREAYAAMDPADPSFRPLVIFPGFELSVHGGLHLLAVFDPASDMDDVAGTIAACGYNAKRGATNAGLSEHSFAKCVRKIKERNGLSIAAHIDEACGLLWNKLNTGEEIRELMRNDGLTHEQAIARMIAEQRLAPNASADAQKLNQTVEDILAAGLDALEVREWDRLPGPIQDHPALARLPR